MRTFRKMLLAFSLAATLTSLVGLTVLKVCAGAWSPGSQFPVCSAVQVTTSVAGGDGVPPAGCGNLNDMVRSLASPPSAPEEGKETTSTAAEPIRLTHSDEDLESNIAAEGHDSLEESGGEGEPISASDELNELAEKIRLAMEADPTEAQRLVVSALSDEDDNKRYRALETAIHEGILLERALLKDVLTRDLSALVRTTAFQALTISYEREGEEVRELVDFCLEQEDPIVVDLARDWRPTLPLPRAALQHETGSSPQ